MHNNWWFTERYAVNLKQHLGGDCVLDPYRHYPESWKSFTLEQCAAMEREVISRTSQIESERKEAQKIKTNASYFGLIPVVCLVSVFTDGFDTILWYEKPIFLAFVFIVLMFAYTMGLEYYITANKKLPSKVMGTVQVVAAFAVCYIAATLIYGYLN